MITQELLNKLLKVWINKKQLNLKQDHLDDLTLFKLAQKGGMENIHKADSNVINHLLVCSRCFNQWKKWCESVIDVDEAGKETQTILSYGMLEAASSKDSPHAQFQDRVLMIHSKCSRFTLSILPQIKHPKKGLITFEVTGAQSMDGKQVIVKDQAGKTVIHGILYDNRIAVTSSNISDYDFSTWSVSIN